MLYHASQTGNIKLLEPRTSNHNTPLIYFSAKRENVLVYLSNVIEKYCKETNFVHNGKWHKWMLEWIESTIKSEYLNAGAEPDYKYFLKAKFPFLSSDC